MRGIASAWGSLATEFLHGHLPGKRKKSEKRCPGKTVGIRKKNGDWGTNIGHSRTFLSRDTLIRKPRKKRGEGKRKVRNFR